MARTRYAKGGSRDPGDFVAIPRAVLTSPAYISLGHSARALLWDVASQYTGRDNGKMLCAWTYMSEEKGWRGKHTLISAKRELLEQGLLLVETRMGRFPSTAAWYACTWWALDWDPAMDLPRDQFPRGAYRREIARLGAVSAQSSRATGAETAPSAASLGAKTAPVAARNSRSLSADSALLLESPSTSAGRPVP